MSTTRKLTTALANTPHQNRVQPTKSLLVVSMPCEQKAAYIRNEALNAIEKLDTKEVVYRFKQNKTGQANALFTAVLMMTMLGLMIKEIFNALENPSQFHNTKSLYGDLHSASNYLMIVCTLMTALMIPPNIANTLRYRKTKNDCQQYLNNILDEKTMRKLNDIPREKKNTNEFYETHIASPRRTN